MTQAEKIEEMSNQIIRRLGFENPGTIQWFTCLPNWDFNHALQAYRAIMDMAD